MILEESDTSIIKQLLQDCQWYIDNYPEFLAMSVGHAVSLNARKRYQRVQEKVHYHTPLLLKSLEEEMPKGFMILKTCDHYLAFSKDGHLRVKGPTTEFQARLWCWENASIIANSSEYANVSTE